MATRLASHSTITQPPLAPPQTQANSRLKAAAASLSGKFT